MTSFNLDEVTKALEGTTVVIGKEDGISFEGKNLKLNTADNAEPIVNAILACKNLSYLNLAGNTLGVEAAAAIAKVLEKRPEFKRALWKDMFTGRLKEEIPKALEYLGKGLVIAEARLSELDLSDNAFGPIGVAGLANLLKSPACFGLQILKLNNNGLGIGGGRMLAHALTDCYELSKKKGSQLTLKVFIAGRNRLENEGAKALSKVFEKIGSLEEIQMPQNGIYHSGITALSASFAKNKNLQILNLNDNTIGPKGSKALSKALINLQQLRVLNLGDCLLKNSGAELLAKAFTQGHILLEEINLEANEIRPAGGLAIAKALSDKQSLTKLLLDGNQFGRAARADILKMLKDFGLGNALREINDDESEGSDEDDDDDDEEEEEEESEEEEEDVSSKESILSKEMEHTVSEAKKKTITVGEFLNTPNSENFMALGENKTNLLIKEATEGTTVETYLDKFIPVLMKVGALSQNSSQDVIENVISVTDTLYKELFSWGQTNNQISTLNNALLVHLGLIKSEDKKYKPQWNLTGCLNALNSALKQSFFPAQTKDTLKAFMNKSTVDSKLKSQIITSLNK